MKKCIVIVLLLFSANISFAKTIKTNISIITIPENYVYVNGYVYEIEWYSPKYEQNLGLSYRYNGIENNNIIIQKMDNYDRKETLKIPLTGVFNKVGYLEITDNFILELKVDRENRIKVTLVNK